MKTKIKYADILAAAAIIAAFPLDVKVKEEDKEYTRSLNGKLTGRILSLIANLNLHSKTFEKLKSELNEAVKTEGFDERYKAYLKAKEKDKAFVDEVFEQELKETNKRFSEGVNQLMDQEVEFSPALLSKKEYESIIEHTKGAEIKINGKEIPRLHWLTDLESILVEK